MLCPSARRPWLWLPVSVCLLTAFPASAAPRERDSVDFRIQAVIPEARLVTTMHATPQTLTLNAQGQGEPPIKFHLDLPPAARKVPLHPDQLTVNGYPLIPRPESDLRVGAAKVVLVFDRADILGLLGSPGDHLLSLRVRIGGGHLLEATDTVRVNGHGYAPAPVLPAAPLGLADDSMTVVQAYPELDLQILTITAPIPIPD